MPPLFALNAEPESLQAPSAWPMAARPRTGGDRGARARTHVPLSDPQGLVTCTHGGPSKFLAAGRYGYFEVIRKRLREVGGKHLHIGSLPAAVVAQFSQNLAAEGIDPARFEPLLPVRGLWTVLRDSRVDIVISSMPVEGARGLIEAMGAGMPVLVHASALSPMQASPELVYPEVLRWRTPEELVEVLRGLDAPMLQAHAVAARAHYERWHRPHGRMPAVQTTHASLTHRSLGAVPAPMFHADAMRAAPGSAHP